MYPHKNQYSLLLLYLFNILSLLACQSSNSNEEGISSIEVSLINSSEVSIKPDFQKDLEDYLEIAFRNDTSNYGIVIASIVPDSTGGFICSLTSKIFQKDLKMPFNSYTILQNRLILFSTPFDNYQLSKKETITGKFQGRLESPELKGCYNPAYKHIKLIHEAGNDF